MSDKLDGWTLVEREDGVRFIERPKPGSPGTVERIYDPDRAETRDGAVVPSARVAVSEHQPRPRPPIARLAEPARRSILTAVNSHSVQDGLEVGGVLLGRVAEKGTIEVERAVEASTSRGRHFVTLDLRRTTGRLDDLDAVGDWHSHLENARPSEQDAASWRRCAALARAETGAPHFLGLIVKTERYSNHPAIRGYAVDWRGRVRAFDL